MRLCAEVGGALGFSDALNNPARVIAPAIGGVLLGQVGASSLGILGAVIMAWVVFTIWRRLVVQNPPLPGQGESETAAA